LIQFTNQPVPLDPCWPRYCPDRNFPPYRYIPGKAPHPIRHPQGHSYQQAEPTPNQRYSAKQWAENSEYLYGIDLFNFSYWWEAHEAWETDWRWATNDHKMFLQGLIQISAAMIKRHLEQLRGVRNLSQAGRRKLRLVWQSNRNYMGIDLSDLLDRLDTFFQPMEGQTKDKFTVVAVSPLIRLDYPRNNLR